MVACHDKKKFKKYLEIESELSDLHFIISLKVTSEDRTAVRHVVTSQAVRIPDDGWVLFEDERGSSGVEHLRGGSERVRVPLFPLVSQAEKRDLWGRSMWVYNSGDTASLSAACRCRLPVRRVSIPFYRISERFRVLAQAEN